MFRFVSFKLFRYSIQIILKSQPLLIITQCPIKLFSGKCRSAPAFQALSTLCLVRNARHKHIALLVSLISGFIWTKTTHISKMRIFWAFAKQAISPPLTFKNISFDSFDKRFVKMFLLQNITTFFPLILGLLNLFFVNLHESLIQDSKPSQA